MEALGGGLPYNRRKALTIQRPATHDSLLPKVVWKVSEGAEGETSPSRYQYQVSSVRHPGVGVVASSAEKMPVGGKYDAAQNRQRFPYSNVQPLAKRCPDS